MLYRIALILILNVFTINATLAEELCPDFSKSISSKEDDMHIPEKEFNLQSAFESIAWLESDIWKKIESVKTTEELTRLTESFEIPLNNGVSTIKGTLYKQNAQLALEKLEIAKLKMASGKATQQDVNAAQKQADTAKHEFCNLLEKTKYDD